MLHSALRRLPFFAFTGLALIANPAFADSGTLGNNLDFPITYQVGVPDENGFVSWQDYTLEPCTTHEWNWDQSGPPNIHMLTPLYADLRQDEYGNIIKERRPIPMDADGGLSAFFLMGDQIWLDMSGAATMSCAE